MIDGYHFQTLIDERTSLHLDGEPHADDAENPQPSLDEDAAEALLVPDDEPVEVGDGGGEHLHPDGLLAGGRDQLEHVLHGLRPDRPGYVVQQGIEEVAFALKCSFCSQVNSIQFNA